MNRDPRVDPTPVELVGLLRREVPVRVLNVSLSGLLLETAGPLDVGSACELRIQMKARMFVDDIRVVRCMPVQGSPAYRVGAQFLWTSRAGPDSVRRLAASFRTGLVHDCGN